MSGYEKVVVVIALSYVLPFGSFSFVPILLSSYKLHVLVHSLLFSAFFALELLWDKGEKGCNFVVLQTIQASYGSLLR